MIFLQCTFGCFLIDSLLFSSNFLDPCFTFHCGILYFIISIISLFQWPFFLFKDIIVFFLFLPVLVLLPLINIISCSFLNESYSFVYLSEQLKGTNFKDFVRLFHKTKLVKSSCSCVLMFCTILFYVGNFFLPSFSFSYFLSPLHGLGFLSSFQGSRLLVI